RNGETIRQEILAFHQQQYSADLMTLTLSGNQSLDEMQSWVEDRFSSITNHNLQGKKVEVPIVGELSTGVQVRVEPIKEVRKLILTFPMPSMDEHYG
ncbi:insulinase family protein, partial [Vibrio breoganii]